jgi:hypothetical protein
MADNAVKGAVISDNVSEGRWKGQEFALKEIRLSSTAATTEVEGYIKTAGEKNILRMLRHFLEPTMVKLVLEKAHCSLVELMDKYGWGLNPSASTTITPKSAFLNRLSNISADGKLSNKQRLSSVFLRIIRDIIYGLESLKKIKHIHGHLTPGSVMIFNDFEAKLSMGQHL